MEQEEKEIPAQDQPSQDKPELSQELSPLPYTLYENDTQFVLFISVNQLTIGVEYNKLLVIEGSSYVNDESNKYGKVIKNMAPRTRFEDSAYY
ncbi:10763_t:CDS:2 [Rhizophagus irregularis]|nr:10763_t:CDS:2 [Rhizophagus irregularis]